MLGLVRISIFYDIRHRLHVAPSLPIRSVAMALNMSKANIAQA